MIGQLLEGSFFETYGLMIILIVFLVFMLVFSASKRKKDAKMAEDFANNLKIGDKIKTYSGIYGRIISIKDTPNGKICIIETGEGKHVSYMAVDVYAIYNIETPVSEKKAAEDKNAKLSEPAADGAKESKDADAAETKVEAQETQEPSKTSEETTEEKSEEKPADEKEPAENGETKDAKKAEKGDLDKNKKNGNK